MDNINLPPLSTITTDVIRMMRIINIKAVFFMVLCHVPYISETPFVIVGIIPFLFSPTPFPFLHLDVVLACHFLVTSTQYAEDGK